MLELCKCHFLKPYLKRKEKKKEWCSHTRHLSFPVSQNEGLFESINHNDLKVLFAKGSPLNKRVYYSLIFGQGAITILALGFGLLYPHSLRSFGYKAQTRELI